MQHQDFRTNILSQIAKLRILVMDNDLTHDECQLLDANLAALLKDVEHKCGKGATACDTAAS